MLSSLTHWLFQNVLFNCHRFVTSSNFLLLLIIDLILLLLKIFWIILILLNSLGLFLCPKIWSTWRMLYVHSRGMSIMLMLGGVFYRCLLGFIVVTSYIYLSFIQFFLQLLLLSIFPINIVSLCFIYFETLIITYVYNYYLFLIN